MKDLDLISKVYFIGIGGIGMSATAAVAKEHGFEVVGSDAKTVYDPAKTVIDELSIPVFLGYDKQHIIDTPADLYVVSSGEDLHNPEVAYLEEQGIEYVSFSSFLYELSKDKIRIVVTGTHGKSTTAGLIGYLLSLIDNSSFVVGGVLQSTGKNFHVGDGHYFVFEGDEYKALWNDPTPKFAEYHADALVLTNLELDHPDVFSSIEEIKTELAHAITNLPDDGIVIFNGDNHALSEVAFHDNKPDFAFGKEADVKFKLLEFRDGNGYSELEVLNKQNKENPLVEVYRTSLVGEMNAYNALAAITLLRVLGFSSELIAQHLPGYTGIKRRFEVVKTDPFIVIDDYAHHPTAVRETLRAARVRYPDRKIWAVFEPHTFSRTEATQSELVESFDEADEVLLSEIYPAREKWREGMITSAEVMSKIQMSNDKFKTHGRTVKNKEEAKEILKNELSTGDVVIVMAVGSFNHLSYEL